MLKVKGKYLIVIFLIIIAIATVFKISKDEDKTLNVISKSIMNVYSDQEHYIATSEFVIKLGSSEISHYEYTLDEDITKYIVDSNMGIVDPKDEDDNCTVMICLKYNKHDINLYKTLIDNPDKIKLHIRDENGNNMSSPDRMKFDSDKTPSGSFVW